MKTPSPLGLLVCPPEVNRTPSVCLLSTWMAMELVPNGGREELMESNFCNLEQKPSPC